MGSSLKDFEDSTLSDCKTSYLKYFKGYSMIDCNVYSGSDFEVPSLRAFQGSFLKVCEHFFLMGCVGSLNDCEGSSLSYCNLPPA